MDSADYFPGLNKAVLTMIAKGWQREFKEIERVSIHARCGERKSKYVTVIRLKKEARPRYERDKFFDLITRIEEAYKEDEIYNPPRKAREGDWGYPEILFEDESLPENIQPDPALLLLSQTEPPRKRRTSQAPEPIEPIMGGYVHMPSSGSSAKKKSFEQILFETRQDVGGISIEYDNEPLISPDGYKNERKVFRWSRYRGISNWQHRLLKNPRYYRTATEQELIELARFKYKELYGDFPEGMMGQSARQYKKNQNQEQDNNIPRPIRANQRHKAECRRVAAEIWQKELITIEDMARRDEIFNIWQGERKNDYSTNTIRAWIKDLAPNRNPGRRPK